MTLFYCNQSYFPWNYTTAFGCHGSRHEPFSSNPMGVRSISLGSLHVRYAPWGCIVRAVTLTTSRKIPTRKTLPLYRSF